MVVSVFSTLIDFFIGIWSRAVAWIVRPIVDVLVNWNVIPENYLTVANNFIQNVLDYLAFARQVIINVTGLPGYVINILGTILIFNFSFFMICLPLKFVLNSWGLFRSAKSFQNEVNS